MTAGHNQKLIGKVLIIGGVIAILSYLFHPGVGQLSVMINGAPVADPLFRFAAIPTLLVVMAIAGILSLLLFLGVGVFIFFLALFFAILGIALIAPYFWPMLVIIFLIIALMSFSHDRKD